jgi:micrococcal nuclease
LPDCQWCGRFEKKLHEIPNGRAIVRLCDMCAAELSVRSGGFDSPAELFSLASVPGGTGRPRGAFRRMAHHLSRIPRLPILILTLVLVLAGALLLIFFFLARRGREPEMPMISPAPRMASEITTSHVGWSGETVFLLAGPATPISRSFTGTCIGVSDGDTITVLRDRKVSIKVRLEGIDAPELHQDFGQKARKFTAAMVFGKVVTVNVLKNDRYGRSVARVMVNGKDVSLELVRAGLAWHYRHYSRDPALARAEADARAKKRGLWSMPAPVPPWDYRHGGQGREGMESPHTCGPPAGAPL